MEVGWGRYIRPALESPSKDRRRTPTSLTFLRTVIHDRASIAVAVWSPRRVAHQDEAAAEGVEKRLDRTLEAQPLDQFGRRVCPRVPHGGSHAPYKPFDRQCRIRLGAIRCIRRLREESAAARASGCPNGVDSESPTSQLRPD